MKKITDDELTLLQGLQKEFSQAKLDLGNTVLQQQTLLTKVSDIRAKFTEQEKLLMETYGEDVTINLETGEVTEKEEPELTKVETE
tara:strand:- start:165 stop:422 length:258 start_codon:yes stop_codon:yes gene_type:complete